MSEPLQDPFKLGQYLYRDDDGWSSVEESPTINRAANRDVNDDVINEDGGHTVDYSRARDLSFLTSANFSQTSLGGDESPSYSRDAYTGRYSSNVLSSPVMQAAVRSANASKPRPKSALFLAEMPLSEDQQQSPIPASRSGRARPRSALFLPDNSLIEDQLMSPINSSFKSSSKRSYVPPPIIAPPMTSRSSSPTRSSSPSRSRHLHPKSPSRRSSSPTKNYLPFNFQPQEIMLHNNGSSLSLVVKPAHRKGHKYKHSSVSMNFFQEPAPAQIIEKQLPALPNSYPIPTFAECVNSLTLSQRWKLVWSSIHLLTSLVVFLAGHKIYSPELATIAHFVFYDSLGSFMTVMVDIMSNFEVWSQTSITFPFGLERLEVLMGFALAASLVMVGLDLLSHSFEEFLSFVLSIEDGGNHAHHIHGDTERNLLDKVFYYGSLVLTMAVTLVTSNFILATEKINTLIATDETPKFSHNRNQSKAGGLLEETTEKSDNFGKVSKLMRIITKYPTHILTLLYALFLTISPLISEITLERFEVDINEVTSLLVSLLFSFTGWKLVRALGGILILSYPSTDYDYHQLRTTLTENIEDLDCYKTTYTIDKLFITKFSYKLFVIGMKIGMSGGSSDDEARIRFEISRLIRRRLQKENLVFNDRDVEITIDIDRL